MSSRLTLHDKTLFRVIGEVLHYVWDPIGVAGLPQTRDEYDGYVEPVFTMLKAGCSKSELASHLVRVADERMGLPDRTKTSNKTASALVVWRDFLAERSA